MKHSFFFFFLTTSLEKVGPSPSFPPPPPSRTFSISNECFSNLSPLPRGISILIFSLPVSRINLHSFGNKLEYCLRRDKYLQPPFMNVTVFGAANHPSDIKRGEETPRRSRGSRGKRYYQVDNTQHLVCPSRARYEPFRLVYAVIWPTTTDLNSRTRSYKKRSVLVPPRITGEKWHGWKLAG